MNRSTVLGLAALAVAGGASAAHAESFATLYRFTGQADGQQPSGNLAVRNGTIYGTTLGTYRLGDFSCAAPGCGTVFAFSQTAGTLATLYDFTPGAKGYFPNGLTAFGNKLVGVTMFGGVNERGTIFAVNPANRNLRTVAAVTPADYGALVPVAYDAKLYGFSSSATTGKENPRDSEGSIYQLGFPGGALETLYNFKGGQGDSTDGYYPLATPVVASGILYGTTSVGGANHKGVIVQLDLATKSLKELYSFSGLVDGKQPAGPVILRGGMLFGTSTFGGIVNNTCPGGCGTAWRFDIATGTFTTLHEFTGADGAYPVSSAMLGDRLLVASGYGGKSGDGTIVSVDSARGGTRIVQDFSGVGNGATPGSLVNSGGAVYGVTSSDTSADNKGTIFRIEASQ